MVTRLLDSCHTIGKPTDVAKTGMFETGARMAAQPADVAGMECGLVAYRAARKALLRPKVEKLEQPGVEKLGLVEAKKEEDDDEDDK